MQTRGLVASALTCNRFRCLPQSALLPQSSCSYMSNNFLLLLCGMQLTYQLEERLPGVASYYAAHPSDSGPLASRVRQPV